MTLSKKLAELKGKVSWRKPKSSDELRESELRFRQVTENIREVFFLVDPEMTEMLYISPGYAEIWGRSCESLYADPRSFIEAIHVDDRDLAVRSFAPHGRVVPFDVEYRVVRPDGAVRSIRARGFPIHDASGSIIRFAGIAEDITERRAAIDLVDRQAKSLEQSNRRLALIGEMTSLLQTVVRVEEAGAIIGGYLAQVGVGDGGAVYLYRESRNLLVALARWGEIEIAESIAPDDCWGLRRGQPYEPPATQPALRCAHAAATGPSAYLCLPMMVESGALGLLYIVFADQSPERREMDTRFAKMMSDHLGLALANFRLRETLRLEAMQDPLTELYNRRFLEVSLRREFARAERDKSHIAVVMLDVDHFKRFNDVHGHDAGDVALRRLAQVLTESCRAADLPCRFGGEEFAVVIPNATREATTEWAERLLAKVRELRVVADGVVLPQLTVSIGVAFYPEHGEETAEVIQAADRALYAAKHAGRDRYAFSAERRDSDGDGERKTEG